MITFKRIATLPDEKPAWAKFALSVDISRWLGDDTIANVDYSAMCETTGLDATSEVLDPAQNNFVGPIISPFVLGGQPGNTYLIRLRVTSALGSRDEWYIRFEVAPYVVSYTPSCSLDAILE
jgi:hypothetical protein